jgi:hypothetical protein
MSILQDLDLKGLDKLLKFDETGNVQIKSDKAGSFLVKLHTHSTFWQRLQEKFVSNELLWETNPSRQTLAEDNIREMFRNLVKLLMIFDEDLTETLLGQNFFSTLKSICQFVLERNGHSASEIPKFSEYQQKEQKICGPLFLKVTDSSFRESFFKMKYLYQHFLTTLLCETKNETFTVIYLT